MTGCFNAYILFVQNMKGRGMTKRELGEAFRNLSSKQKKELQNIVDERMNRRKKLRKVKSFTTNDESCIHRSFRIRVFWPHEKKWFDGLCHPTNAKGNNYIEYDDGDSMYHYLPEETWKRIEDLKYDETINTETINTETINAETVNTETINAETIDAAKIMTKMHQDTKATFVMELIKRNNMSIDAIYALIESLMSNMNQAEQNMFLTSLCEMEHSNYKFLGSLLYTFI